MSFKSKVEHKKNEELNEKIEKYIPKPNTKLLCTDYLKKCQIPNYIPHNKTKNINREKWQNNYSYPLIDMHTIVSDIMYYNFPNHKISRNNKSFNNLAKIIYNCSSKYISPYV